MAGRRQRAAFRPAAAPLTSSAPSRKQAIAMVAALVLVGAAITVASFAVKPSKARSFDLFYGSVFIDDNTAPVSIDLASGKPTVRLPDAYQQVNADQPGDVDVMIADDHLVVERQFQHLEAARGDRRTLVDQVGFELALHATAEERAWWSRLWADRCVASGFASAALAHGLADEVALEQLAEAWRAWGEEPDGWFVVLHGEVLARA